VEVLHFLCAVHEDVESGGIGVKAPHLPGLSNVLLVTQIATTELKDVLALKELQIVKK
jgi:hypothetical protein